MSLRCKICGQFMSDGTKHVLVKTPTSHMMGHRDVRHYNAEASFRQKLWKGNCPYCGGSTNHYVFGDKDDPHWEISCSRCGFLWDED